MRERRASSGHGAGAVRSSAGAAGGARGVQAAPEVAGRRRRAAATSRHLLRFAGARRISSSAPAHQRRAASGSCPASGSRATAATSTSRRRARRRDARRSRRRPRRAPHRARREGRIIRGRLQRRQQRIVGRLEVDRAGRGFVVPFDQRVLDRRAGARGASRCRPRPARWCSWTSRSWPTARHAGPVGRIVEVLGRRRRAGRRHPVIIRSFGIPEAHSRPTPWRGAAPRRGGQGPRTSPGAPTSARCRP